MVLSDDDTSSYKKINLQDLRPAEWRIIRSAIVAFSFSRTLFQKATHLGKARAHSTASVVRDQFSRNRIRFKRLFEFLNLIQMGNRHSPH